MIVDRGFIRPLLNGFSDSSVFGVTSQIFFADSNRKREETGKTRAHFNRGFLELWHEEIRPGEEHVETTPVFWAGGGSCAYDRRKYVEIGGFDSLYHPFYIEDTDLSYQAWKRGWKCLLAPASHVLHKHRGTSQPKFGNEFVDNTIRKNLYLFIWKNVTDFSMILDHLRNLPRIHRRGMFYREPGFEIQAFLRALRQLPEALGKRIANLAHYVISDREVLARSQKQ
jgi:GT2 family glycosyltransferase